MIGGDRGGIASGLSPVSSAGTARSVKSATVLALRYQVESRAKLAKAGKRSALIRRSGPIRAEPESSSKKITTTGVWPGMWTFEASTSFPGSTSFDTGEISEED